MSTVALALEGCATSLSPKPAVTPSTTPIDPETGPDAAQLIADVGDNLLKMYP
ncbi:MAG: hypothetical protein ACPG77_10895 [Nannocystaceae bacterium]